MPKPLIIDLGVNVAFAERLAREMEVAYSNPTLDAFPESRETAPATGIQHIEIVDDPIRFMITGKASHVAIPDLHLNDYDYLARQIGIPVFSIGDANELENDRWKLLEFLAAHDLPVIHTVEVSGIKALGEYLAKPENADKYIKLSRWRGDLDTFHHVRWSSTQVWYEDVKYHLGPWGEKLRFLVQDPIDTEIETGFDVLVHRGVFKLPMTVGVEKKDAAYFCAVLGEMPAVFHPFARAFESYFKQHGSSGFFATEMRIAKDRTIYMTDATCRIPSPPGGVMMAACQNFGDVVLRGAAPNYGDAAYLCELIFKSPWLQEEWLQVSFPASMQDRYAFHRWCIIDGKVWVIPHGSRFVEFGSAVGWGRTGEAAKKMCREAAEALEGYQVTFDNEALDKAEDDLMRFMGRGSRGR